MAARLSGFVTAKAFSADIENELVRHRPINGRWAHGTWGG